MKPSNPSLPHREPGVGAEKQCKVTHRCRRCCKPISEEEQESFFQRTGLCFWCAYVEPQG